MNREQWLLQATKELGHIFTKCASVEVPHDVNVSTGFPSAKGVSQKHKTIGQCWSRKASDNNVNEIFINPCLADSIEVLAVLTHELVHAIDDCENGHKTPFKRIALDVGLEGKMTATVASDDLKIKLQKIVDKLGVFPHKSLNPSIGRKKQGTRLIKVGCECGVVARMSQTAIHTMDWQCGICNTTIKEIY